MDFENLRLKHGDRPPRDSKLEATLAYKVFNHYRKYGFPYVTCDLKTLCKELRRLKETPSCIDGNNIKQSMLGLGVVNAYHPRMLRVQCRNFLTPMEVFDDDDLLYEAILKRIRYGDNLLPWGIRKSVFSMRRAQRVSSFRPTVALSLYRHYDAGNILDFSMGWGGRMLAAIVDGRPYVGIDPCRDMVEGNRRLADDCQEVLGRRVDVTLIQACAEDVLGSLTGGVDMVLTSPPYFDVEKYADEDTQSFIRYPDKEEWFCGFLARCLEGVASEVSPGGVVALNVNPDMEQRTILEAQKAGLTEKETFSMTLSRHQYNKASCGLYRMEPILVFDRL